MYTPYLTMGKNHGEQIVIEVLQFLFATAKDQNLYFNQESLVKELLNEQKFSPSEVQAAIDWFAPVLAGASGLDINPTAIRSITTWEEKHLPKTIIAKILEWENKKIINLTEREILLDRLSELGLDWQLELEDMQMILDGLVYHIQHYKYKLVAEEFMQNPYYWAGNLSVH